MLAVIARVTLVTSSSTITLEFSNPTSIPRKNYSIKYAGEQAIESYLSVW